MFYSFTSTRLSYGFLGTVEKNSSKSLLRFFPCFHSVKPGFPLVFSAIRDFSRENSSILRLLMFSVAENGFLRVFSVHLYLRGFAQKHILLP